MNCTDCTHGKNLYAAIIGGASIAPPGTPMRELGEVLTKLSGRIIRKKLYQRDSCKRIELEHG